MTDDLDGDRMTTIENLRAELDPIMERHHDRWPLDTDLTLRDVREYADYIRRAAVDQPEAVRRDNLLQADELDALVDRIEAAS